MRSDLVPISALAPSDLAAWRDLASRAITPNPFYEPEFVLPAARAFAAADVQLIRVTDGERWLAALPVRRLWSWRRVPGRVHVAWVHYNCFLGTPLVASADVQSVLAELISCVRRERSALILEKTDTEGVFAENLASAVDGSARVVQLDRYERAMLLRHPSDDYLKQAISSSSRSSIRRKLRVMAREYGEVDVRDRTDDPAACDEFLEIERTGWKGKTGTALACLPGQAEFFREVCDAFRANGRLQLLALTTNGRTVAMQCFLLAGEGAFAFKTTFDEELRRLSPGIHLQIEIMHRFHESSVQWFDSCSARDDGTMNRLWTGRRTLQTIVACPRGPAGLARFAKWRTAEALLKWRNLHVRGQQESPPAAR